VLTLTVLVDVLTAREIRHAMWRRRAGGGSGGGGGGGWGVVTTARSLGRERLDDVLVVALENGADWFIAVACEFEPTSFGCTLTQLAYTHAPMRSARRAPAADAAAALATLRPLRVPKEIWRLVDFLYERCGVGGGGGCDSAHTRVHARAQTKDARAVHDAARRGRGGGASRAP
jgi:hypothetical protein